MTCIGLLQLTFDYLDTSWPGMSSTARCTRLTGRTWPALLAQLVCRDDVALIWLRV